MIKHLRVYRLTCVFSLIAAAAAATTIILPTDAQLVAKTPLIVQGTVVSSQPVLRDDGRVWTETKLAVEQTLKGSASGVITIREIGGELDGRITKIFGAPLYQPGSRVMAFLTPTPRGDFQTMDLYVGKFDEARTMTGQRLWTRDDAFDDVTLLDANFHPIKAHNVQRDAARFEAAVRDMAAGRTPSTTNYGVENPVLDGVLPRPGAGRIQDNFTLISEPTVYRWFAFDNGGSANWYSYGTQSGYTGGGTNEIQTAMGSWNNYSQAKIKYVYAGAGSGTPGSVGGSPNGVNEVLFNDVSNDIAGTFNGSGVVGLGGFNGVSGGGAWTPTFSADATHVQKQYNAVNITEANLAIQDGVSPSKGISSSELAEICAHEFGHTLGLGHSADSTALMYAYVTGLGPSLRADDQLAARWLYPNGTQSGGGGGPTAPAAPGNVHATFIGGSSISLTWTDNSTNESGFYVYLAYVGGGYTRVGSTGPAATSATLSGLTPGNYSVYVSAFNSAGESASAPTTVNVPQQQSQSVAAAFTISPSNGTAGSTVFSFIDQSTGPVTSWLWQFGDGTTSSQSNPTHVYSGAGTYTVILTVNGNGTSSQTNHLVAVAAPIPVTPPVTAAFSFGPSTPKTGDTVSFTDQSSGSPVQWFWWFGDGATSTSNNPTHTYASPGTYPVTLQVWNATTTSTTSKSVTVAAYAAFRSLVSAAAQIGGAGNSVWRTELTLFNASTTATATGQFLFIPGAGGTVVTQPLYLAPQQSVTYANALPDIFGIASGAGAIAIEATSPTATPDIKITSRTFTTGSSGTYGQAVPQVPADDLQQTLFVTGIESDDAYRTNIGLVNRTGSAVPVAMTLLASDGTAMATANVTVPANNFQQNSLASYFPAVNGQTRDGMTLRAVAASAGAISVYASVVNNDTQDPIYIQGIAAATASRVVIPAVGRAPGIGGTYWRSDVTLMNPNPYGVRVGWRYLPAGGDNTAAGWSSLNLAAGETRVLRDVASVFGVTSGTGALEFSADGFTAPIITSRTYTSTSSGGTYGQSIDPVFSYRGDVYVPGLRNDAAYRSNVGFYNNSDTTTGVTATLVNLNGQTIAQTFVPVPAHAPVQFSLGALFPHVELGQYQMLTLHAHTDGGNILFAYGSVVDNSSGDPVFFAAQ